MKSTNFEFALEQIKKIIADDENYQSASLKLGGIWHWCDTVGTYERGVHTEGTYVNVQEKKWP